MGHLVACLEARSYGILPSMWTVRSTASWLLSRSWLEARRRQEAEGFPLSWLEARRRQEAEGFPWSLIACLPVGMPNVHADCGCFVMAKHDGTVWTIAGVDIRWPCRSPLVTCSLMPV